MRDEQYYALANLIRRPMRRWWAKVGSWWLVGIGLLLVSQAIQVGVETQAMFGGTYHIKGNIFGQDWYELFRILTNASLILSVGVALHCATNLFGLIDRTTHETLVFSEARLRVYKYKLALLNCWPVLVPIFLKVIFYLHWMMARQFGETYSVWLLVMYSLELALPFFILVLWLLALSVVTTGTRWQVWGILICSQLPVILVLIITNGNKFVFSNFFSTMGRFNFSKLEEAAVNGIGLITIYFLIYLFLTGKNKPASVISLLFCAILLVPNTIGLFGIYAIDNLQMASMLTERSTQPLSLSYSPFSLNLILNLGGFNWKFPAGPAWAIVPVINGIFWLFAHYFAFRWLMGRKYNTGRREASSRSNISP